MRQEWSPEDVVACWTLVDGDWDLLANKSGPTRLGFCLMLKFLESEGRFPEFTEEFPQAAVEYVAGLVKVPAGELVKYGLAGAKRHRKQIREALGFRPATLADEETLTAWLAADVCPVELLEDRQREALLLEYRSRKIEPPGPSRIEKNLVAARRRWEKEFCPGPFSAWDPPAAAACWLWSRMTTTRAPRCWPRSSAIRGRWGWTLC
ncbi:DUF4158 domain-containing protein [Streptomyces lydicus]|uniref:DUF4158 domain-containing protein n=1 Tax=Streptomyces lydicus TaxID=47763 RepID=UPI003722D1F4